MAEVATREEEGRLTVSLSGDWTLMALTSLPTSLRWVLQRVSNAASTFRVLAKHAFNVSDIRLAADMRRAAAAAGLTDPLSLHDVLERTAFELRAAFVRASAPNAVMGMRHSGILSALRPYEPIHAASGSAPAVRTTA